MPPPTTTTDLERFKSANMIDLAACFLHADGLIARVSFLDVAEFEECPIIGIANKAKGMPAGKMSWSHDFQIGAVCVAAGARLPAHACAEAEVLLVYAGHPRIDWPASHLDLGPGDALTVLPGLERSNSNGGHERSVVYVVRGGDHPEALRWVTPQFGAV